MERKGGEGKIAGNWKKRILIKKVGEFLYSILYLRFLNTRKKYQDCRSLLCLKSDAAIFDKNIFELTHLLKWISQLTY